MCQPIELRPGTGLDEERQASFPAVLTEMTFAVAGLFFGIAQGHGRNSYCVAMVIQ
jgi:hypothetical protein